MQLVNDKIKMIDPMKMTNIGREEVFKKFGAYPDKVVDVQALAGDSTDNIPGFLVSELKQQQADQSIWKFRIVIKKGRRN